MRFKMLKCFTAMMMCAAIAVMSCLPVSAADQDSCSHSHTTEVDYGRGARVVKNGFCGDCACANCPAVITYQMHYVGLVCVDCNKLLTSDTLLEYESHTCSCTTCECVCGYY